jgi:hypothetical protein
MYTEVLLNSQKKIVQFFALKDSNGRSGNAESVPYNSVTSTTPNKKLHIHTYTLILTYLFTICKTRIHGIRSGRSRVRFPLVSQDFFIDTILPAALWPWG